MLNETIPLKKISEVLKIHPRTIARHLEGDINAYWKENWNPDINVDKLCEAFGFDHDNLDRILSGKDETMKQQEMALFIDVSIRVFKRRKYPAMIRVGRVVRYSRYDTTRYNVANYM